MNLSESNNDLTSFFNQKEFVASTITQINKDLQGLFFEDYVIDLEHSEHLLDDSVAALAPILTILSKRQPEQLSQFIYKVDLNEKNTLIHFQKIIHSNIFHFSFLNARHKKYTCANASLNI